MGNKSTKNIVYSVFSVAAIVTGSVLAYRSLTREKGQDEGLGRPVHFICRADECGNEFTISLADYLVAVEENDERVPCSRCSSVLTVQAYQCYACSSLVEEGPHGIWPETCSNCGVKLGVAVNHTHEDGSSHDHLGGATDHEHEPSP